MQLPNAKALSLAFMTFFPDAVGVYHGEEATFDARQHPSPFFVDAEAKFIGWLIG